MPSVWLTNEEGVENPWHSDMVRRLFDAGFMPLYLTLAFYDFNDHSNTRTEVCKRPNDDIMSAIIHDPVLLTAAKRNGESLDAALLCRCCIADHIPRLSIEL